MLRLVHRFLGVSLLALSACSAPTPAAPTVAVAPTTPPRATNTSAPAGPVASAQPTSSPAAVAVASPSVLVNVNVTMPTTDPAVHVFLWGNAATTSRDLRLAR